MRNVYWVHRVERWQIDWARAAGSRVHRAVHMPRTEFDVQLSEHWSWGPELAMWESWHQGLAAALVEMSWLILYNGPQYVRTDDGRAVRRRRRNCSIRLVLTYS